jgi:acyl-CoA reductase-like NAD-dependent aldehyde dehydrogenase
MIDHYPLLVPGSPAPGEPMEVDAPWDGSIIGTVDTAGAEVVDRALATAHALFRDRDAWLPRPERIEILRRAAAIMQERREHLATEAAREGGKPLVDSLVEVDRAIEGALGCIDALRTQAGHGIPMNLNAASAHRVAFTRHEPIGVVVAFSAFNHPVNLIVHQVFPGVAAGCPVIVKPAEATPLSCMRLVGILHEAGLPEAWCQALLTTDLDVSGKLVSDPRVGFFSFIGSGRVGRWSTAGRPRSWWRPMRSWTRSFPSSRREASTTPDRSACPCSASSRTRALRLPSSNASPRARPRCAWGIRRCLMSTRAL